MSEACECEVGMVSGIKLERAIESKLDAMKQCEYLEKENVELKARLDKWESQTPVAWLDEENDVFRYCPPENWLLQPCAPLFTRPKETDNAN